MFGRKKKKAGEPAIEEPVVTESAGFTASETTYHTGAATESALVYETGMTDETDNADNTDNKAAKAKRAKVNPVVAVLSVLLCLVMLVAVCAVIFRIAGGGRKVRISLNDYVDVTFEGYEGEGTAVATFDETRFLADYSGKIKPTRKAKNLEGDDSEIGMLVSMYAEEEDAADIFFMLFENGTLTPSEELSNGDETVFSWNLTELAKKMLKDYLGCAVEAGNMVFYVSGLDDVRTVDVFKGLTLRFTGGEPNGRAEIDTPSEYENADMLSYTIEPEDGLRNGDTVTVTVSAYGDDVNTFLAEEYGVRAKETEMTFTVEGLSSFAESYEDLTDEVIRRMDQKGQGLIEDVFDADPEAFGNSEIENIGALFLRAEDPETAPEGYNGVVMLYKVAVMVTAYEDGYEYPGRADYYTCVLFRDITTDEFGASEVDTDAGELTNASFTFNIPDTYLEGEGWLTQDLRGYDTMESLLSDCDSRYGYDYTITEYLDGYEPGNETGRDTAEDDETYDAGTTDDGTDDTGLQEGELQDGEDGTLEEETPDDSEGSVDPN